MAARLLLLILFVTLSGWLSAATPMPTIVECAGGWHAVHTGLFRCRWRRLEVQAMCPVGSAIDSTRIEIDYFILLVNLCLSSLI